MEASVCIEQKGTVEEISDHFVLVRIQRDTACGHCNVQSMCSLGDVSLRTIEVEHCNSDIRVGDTVRVNIARNLGNKAVFLAYFLPFLLLLVSLIVLQSLGIKEWINGLLSLLILIPYYLILHILKNRLKRTFIFSLRKND